MIIESRPYKFNQIQLFLSEIYLERVPTQVLPSLRVELKGQ
jgi:hypothetical protein